MSNHKSNAGSGIYLFFFASLFVVNVQAQNWAWARMGQINSNTFAIGAGVTADPAGNVYVTGNYTSPTITFGSIVLTNTSSNGSDLFVVKYNAGGIVVWAKNFGGIYSEGGNAITVDRSGNLIVTGYFNSPSITFGTTNLSSAGGYDIFLLKLDFLGNVIWARSAGGSGNDEAKAVCADRKNNICISGDFISRSIAFGSTILTDSTTSYSPFTAKYDSSGSPLWARTAKGVTGVNTNNSGAGIAVDNSMNVYVTGSFCYASIRFGSFNLVNAGIANVFVVKYDSLGTIQWARNAGGANTDASAGIGCDPAGNCYITGSFNSPSITFGSTTLTNAGSSDLFIVKYNPGGTVVWAQRAGGPGLEQGSTICVDANGYAYVAGSFGSNLFALGNGVLSNSGNLNIFVAELDWGGNILWARSAGGTFSDYALSSFAGTSGNAYLAGYIGSTSVSFGSSTLIHSGYADMYAAKISGVTGIETFITSNIQQVLVYPNPFSGSATVLLKENPDTPFEFVLYNQLGQLVRKMDGLHSQQFEIQKEDLEPGVYIYTLQDEHRNFLGRGKVVVQ